MPGRIKRVGKVKSQVKVKNTNPKKFLTKGTESRLDKKTPRCKK